MTTFLRLEQCLLPPPETVHWNKGNPFIEKCSTTQKVTHCVINLITLIGLLLILPVTLAYDWTQKKVVPIREAPDIVPTDIVWPPTERGFACSLFQTSGLGTKWAAPQLAGKCDWDKWMDTPEHIRHPKGFNYKHFFTDILSDPDPYIKMLQAHNVTAHRFSLEWSVIEPGPGEIDTKAVALYQNFIEKLLKAHITPSVTLNHFTVPEWFYESGNFQEIKNIDRYVDYALRAIELFPKVTTWWSFNELGIKAFQQAREVYPTDVPEGSYLATRVHAAGIATSNMLMAHCKLHREVTRLHPQKKIGVTHQWLKFDTANGNWLERLFAYFFTKFAFSPVYQFFKEGHYSFEFPFMANIHFKIPQEEFEANDHFLMSLGVQAYPQPMVKMGLNHGETYPGSSSTIKNLPLISLGASCEPGGTLMSFGPRWRASGMDEALDEAFKLTKEIYITEYGSDARVWKWGQSGFKKDDEAQAKYLQMLTEQIRDYSVKNFRQIKGIHCWSDLRSQIEWECGHESTLSLVEPILNGTRNIISYDLTPASRYIAEIYN